MCCYAEYGPHTSVSVRRAKDYLKWHSACPDWGLLVLQENVDRDSPSYSDLLSDVVSAPIFSIVSST